jgi:hypothetical protein
VSPLARNRKFESISLQRRVFANLTRSIRSPKILPSELRAASVIRVYIARAVSWRGPGGEVRRLTDDRLVLRRAFADQIADDHQPGGDPDARLELSRFDIQPTDRVDQAEPRPDRPLGIVLMRSRVPEIDQHTIALFSHQARSAAPGLNERLRA